MTTSSYFRSQKPSIIIFAVLLSLLQQIIANPSEIFLELKGGPSEMYYYTNFQVGSKLKEQSAIIDTGSSTFAFPCADCFNGKCGNSNDKGFEIKESTSFKYEIKCPATFLYHRHRICKFASSYLEESSINGFLASNYIFLRDARKTAVTEQNDLGKKSSLKGLYTKASFGCTTKEFGNFEGQFADGIIGLDKDSAFIKSFEKNQAEPEKTKQMKLSFGFCFSDNGGIMGLDFRTAREKYVPNSILVDPKKQGGSYYLSTPFIDEFDSYYNIKATRFLIEGKDLDLPEITFVVDSGTTFSYFPNFYYKTILTKIEEHCFKNKDKCGKIGSLSLSEESCLKFIPDNDFENEEKLLNSFPDILIEFEASEKAYRLRPRNYFYQQLVKKSNSNGAEKIFCLALRGGENNRVIFGAFSMRDFYFYFDLVEKKLDILETDCQKQSWKILKAPKGRILQEVLESTSNGIFILGLFAILILISGLFIFSRANRNSKRNMERLKFLTQS